MKKSDVLNLLDAWERSSIEDFETHSNQNKTRKKIIPINSFFLCVDKSVAGFKSFSPSQLPPR